MILILLLNKVDEIMIYYFFFYIYVVEDFNFGVRILLKNGGKERILELNFNFFSKNIVFCKILVFLYYCILCWLEKV